jgi:hypothetical protein
LHFSLVLWWWCTTVRDLQKEEFYACCTDTISQQPLALCGLCLWVGFVCESLKRFGSLN